MHPITEDEAIAALPARTDSFLFQYVKWACKQTDAPMAYHIGTALSILAVTAPVNHGACIAGPTLHANMFVLLAGRSGEDRKSTAAGMGKALLQAGAPGLIAPEPGSEQGFVDQLAEQPVQLVYYSEFGSFLAKANGGGYYEALKTRLNEVYDGGTVGRKKANGKGVMIERPRVTVLGACATPYLEAYTTPVDWTGGFMGRWLVLFAHRERLYAQGTKPDPALTKALQDDLYQRVVDAGLHGSGECLGFTDAASKRWVEWFHDVNNRDLPEYIIGVRARVSTTALKVALVLAWDYGGVRGGQPWAIDLDVLEPAIKIAELHLQSVVALSELLTESKDMRDRRRILLALKAGPRTSAELLRDAKMLKRRFNDVLDTLLTENSIGRLGDSFVILTEGDRMAAATAMLSVPMLDAIPAGVASAGVPMFGE